MDFKHLALKRESCRDYTGEAVPHEMLCEILESARLAPSACNSQPWRLIAAEGKTAEKLRPMTQAGGANRFTDAVSTFVVICETKATLRAGVAEDSQKFAQIDTGIVTAMLTLAAADNGVASCIMGCFDEAGTKQLLSIPEDAKVRLIIALGYANAKEPRKKNRKPEAEVQSFDRW